MQEHRKLPRWQINQQAKIRLEGAVYDAVCHIKDIDFKGMQIIITRAMQNTMTGTKDFIGKMLHQVLFLVKRG